MNPRVLVAIAEPAARRALAQRLRLQGFAVEECADGADGAAQAVRHPPVALIADLTLPSISGVQLCRVLHSEPRTANVPVILRGPAGRRNQFWADQAGAFAYVINGQLSELVRALRRAIQPPVKSNKATLEANDAQGVNVRERIAKHLDTALFESVIAAEVRRLSTCESFDRLVGQLSQFVSQVTSYRWIGLLRNTPQRFGLHTCEALYDTAMAEARSALGLSESMPIFCMEDDNGVDPGGPAPIVCPIHFGGHVLGALALASQDPVPADDAALAHTIAAELGGPLRMASLFEESRLMATTDPLTELLNRRAFLDQVKQEFKRSARYQEALSIIVLDIDHFKQINDQRGHTSGDRVLVAIARLLADTIRSCDVVARWGGEEFVIALPCTALEGAEELAERIRSRVEALAVSDVEGRRVKITASLGTAMQGSDETLEALIDRADRAMYTAKSAGRNCVQPSASPSTQLHELRPRATRRAG